MRILMMVLPLILLWGCSGVQLKNSEQANVMLKTEIASLEIKLQEYKNEKESLEKKLANFEQELTSFDNEKEQLMSETKSLRNDNAMLNEQIDHLTTLVESAYNNANIPSSSLGSTDVIKSKIDGDFEGWEGETIFKLTNGQIWQQDSYDYHYHYSFMPEVLIFKSGSRYQMQVEGIDKTIYVKKID